MCGSMFEQLSDYESLGLVIKHPDSTYNHLVIDSTKYTGKSHKNFKSVHIDLARLNQIRDNDSKIFLEFDAKTNIPDYTPHLITMLWYSGEKDSPELIEEFDTKIRFFPSGNEHKFVFEIVPPDSDYEFVTLSLYQSVDFSCKLEIMDFRFQTKGQYFHFFENELSVEEIAREITWAESDRRLIVNSFLGEYYVEYPDIYPQQNS